MARILADLEAGHHVGHAARFAVGTFLLAVGIDEDRVVNAFSRQGNFVREKSENIVRGLVERGYTTPNCSRLQAEGVCPKGDRVPLCMSIANPISFWRARSGESRSSLPSAKTEGESRGITEPLVVVRCGCGWVSKPLPQSLQEKIGNLHFWAQPEADEAQHLQVEYVPVASL